MATLMETMLDDFMAGHADGWVQHTADCYRAVFEQLYRAFPNAPGDAVAVIKWVAELEPAHLAAGTLTPSTRLDYYDRIRHLYSWAKLEVPGAESIAELPYRSFRRGRRDHRNGRHHA